MSKAKPANPSTETEVEATFESLLKKPARETKVLIPTVGDDGQEIKLVFRMKALNGKVYDDLVSAHPPKDEDKKNGGQYNVDTFAPALISAASVTPKLSLEQAAELYHSEDWSGGEITSLFFAALRLCNAGLDVPFTAPG